MAKLIKDFDGVPAGAIYPVTYKAGAECPAEFEAAARSVGAIAPDAAAVKPAAKRAKE